MDDDASLLRVSAGALQIVEDIEGDVPSLLQSLGEKFGEDKHVFGGVFEVGEADVDVLVVTNEV